MTIFLFLTGCETKTSHTSAENITIRHHTDAFKKIVDAHGGYDKWSKMKTLSCDKGDEKTIVDLSSRQLRLESNSRTIGYDGQNVWFIPDTLDESKIRFYHNLYFYFLTMPFVVGDKGAMYESLPQTKLGPHLYNQLKITFKENIGDSPKDTYLILSNPTTNRMEWLKYTVTYRKEERNQDFKLIRYTDWVEVKEILLPKTLEWYSFSGESIGNKKSEVSVKNIHISEEITNPSVFDRPNNSKIAPK